jgi:hypothetical protein
MIVKIGYDCENWLYKDQNSQKGRRRRFVAPKPGTTLSHLVKIPTERFKFGLKTFSELFILKDFILKDSALVENVNSKKISF